MTDPPPDPPLGPFIGPFIEPTEAEYAERLDIISEFKDRGLKFTPFFLSATGLPEASWVGGEAIGQNWTDLLATVRAALKPVKQKQIRKRT